MHFCLHVQLFINLFSMKLNGEQFTQKLFAQVKNIKQETFCLKKVTFKLIWFLIWNQPGMPAYEFSRSEALLKLYLLYLSSTIPICLIFDLLKNKAQTESALILESIDLI